MRHRYVPRPTWKIFYGISYYDFAWNEIKPMARTGLDAFAVTGAVYEFTQMWAKLERGQPVEVPTSEIPIAFTVEVYHVESQENEVVATERLRPGHTSGCDSGPPGGPGSRDDVSGSLGLYDAALGRQDTYAAVRPPDNQSRRSALDYFHRYADGSYDWESSDGIIDYCTCGLQPRHPREAHSLVAFLGEDEKKVADG